MRTLSFIAMCVTLAASLVASADSAQKLAQRSERAAEVLAQIQATPDSAIPDSLLKQSVCIATIPNVLRAGFGFGARHGKGLVSCRTGHGWSQPSYLTITGGSFGFQIGIQSADVVLVFVHPTAIANLSKNDFTLGGDASIAAGPVGRNAEAGVDYKLDNDVYAYSRARGLFAGLAISGSLMHPDMDSNRIAYSSGVTVGNLLTTTGSARSMNPYTQALNARLP